MKFEIQVSMFLSLTERFLKTIYIKNSLSDNCPTKPFIQK